MAIQRILAMTAEEIRNHPSPPSGFAYLGCHLSAELGKLSGLPEALPKGCGLVIDDRNLISQVDEKAVTEQIAAFNPAYVILDFQRSPTEPYQKLADALTKLPCPVPMPPAYGKDHHCPVFLPPIPPNVPMPEHFAPWTNRQIWLELALDAVEITVTAKGSQVQALPFAEDAPSAHMDSMLHCHYKISQQSDALRFYCYRTRSDVEEMLRTPLPENLTHAVGLFREFGA